ncbi:hypothetical protein WJX81_005726 [Elliptochloris bilobata]|uniref:Methyltransferase type 11 domain-containing protein n=1 Tax=Elliptochloris bilobata TaxID=381761 RepID=A0AAW1SIC3_9CHLO
MWQPAFGPELEQREDMDSLGAGGLRWLPGRLLLEARFCCRGSPEHTPGWHVQFGRRSGGNCGSGGATGDSCSSGDEDGSSSSSGGGFAACSMRLRQDGQGRMAARVQFSGGGGVRWSACADWERGPGPGLVVKASLGAVPKKLKGARLRLLAAEPAAVVSAALLDQIVKPFTSGGKKTPLNQGIANFYDESSGLWEQMWGEHMHHGYYPAGSREKSNKEAQVDMIEEVLSWAGVTGAKEMVDVGCGIGGSSRHIARKFGCAARGITLSPVQAQRANALAAEQGLAERVSFQVADALQQPFGDASFDLVWSMESGEHMPDKEKFVGELARVCMPGGRIIIVTWCHRNLQPGESGLSADEQALLDRICEAYYLPAWCSVDDYCRIFEAQGLQVIKTADWSEEVAPFWGAVIRSALSAEGFSGLFKAGWTTIKGALVMPLMARGFQMGLVKFNLITATKP